jgi:hypothetical protein
MERMLLAQSPAQDLLMQPTATASHAAQRFSFKTSKTF